MRLSGYFRLTRDIPTLSCTWKAGEVVALRCLTLQSHHGNLVGLTDLSALEPIDAETGRAAVESRRMTTPLKPWAGMKLPEQPTLEEVRARRNKPHAVPPVDHGPDDPSSPASVAGTEPKPVVSRKASLFD